MSDNPQAERPTPETDALLRKFDQEWLEHIGESAKQNEERAVRQSEDALTLAETLERSRDALREQLAEANGRLAAYAQDYPAAVNRAEAAEKRAVAFERSLDLAHDVNEQLREQLSAVADELMHDDDAHHEKRTLLQTAQEWTAANERLMQECNALRKQLGELATAHNDLLLDYEAAEQERERAEADARRMRETLEWLNRKGGLGLDVHDRIDAALAQEPPHE